MTVRITEDETKDEQLSSLDLELVFQFHYRRIVRVVNSIVRNPARSEELAVEPFLRLSVATLAPNSAVGAWLTRVAVRIALDESRRQRRRERLDGFALRLGIVRTPEEVLDSSSQQARVVAVLRALKSRDAELLLLKADGVKYDELAAVLGLNPASVGKLLTRAHQAFRKEYVRRYGSHE